jgi:hypothetical protein
MALASGGSGVTLSGAGKINAPACAVISNATNTNPGAIVAPNSSATVTAPVVATPQALTTAQKQFILPPTGTSSVTYLIQSTTDPLAGNSGVASAVNHLSGVGLMASPSAPTATGGTNITFDYTATGKTFPSGCTGSFASPTWTVTCSGAGPFTFGNISLGGGITVNFTNAATATYNFNGLIDSSGTALNFSGPGIYNIVKGVATEGGSTTTFPVGTYNIGVATAACNGGGRYSICNQGTSLTFAGPSTFVLSNGIYNKGGSILTLGSTGTTANSYRIGSSSDGNALLGGGGAKTTFYDATASGSVFQMVGKLNIGSGGGSCLTLPAATDHDINGSFSTAGGTVLGSGTYTINGYVALGANGGGDVTCGATTVGIQGANVTFVASASTTISSGTCSNTVFCVASGYGHVTLTAPTTGTYRNLVVIGPTTSTSTAGANFAEGASMSISGTFYVPYGPISFSGAAAVNFGNGSGQCLELIGSQVTLSQGTAAVSACTGVAGPSIFPGGIALVQ